jgi:hypothetical protein
MLGVSNSKRRREKGLDSPWWKEEELSFAGRLSRSKGLGRKVGEEHREKAVHPLILFPGLPLRLRKLP